MIATMRSVISTGSKPRRDSSHAGRRAADDGDDASNRTHRHAISRLMKITDCCDGGLSIFSCAGGPVLCLLQWPLARGDGLEKYR